MKWHYLELDLRFFLKVNIEGRGMSQKPVFAGWCSKDAQAGVWKKDRHVWNKGIVVSKHLLCCAIKAEYLHRGCVTTSILDMLDAKFCGDYFDLVLCSCFDTFCFLDGR